MSIKNFIISLSTAQERREHVTKEFERQQVEFEFFNAITPSTMDFTCAELGIGKYQSTLHPNEISCLLSHMMVWKKAVDEHLDYVAIFEDDIYLGESANEFLGNTAWIPKEHSLVKLEMFYKKIGIVINNKNISAPNHRKLLLLNEPHMGCAGYLISREVAQELLAFTINSQVLIPVDHIVFREYPKINELKIYQLSPALCVQDMILTSGKTRFPSALEDVRNVRKGKNTQKEKLPLSAKIQKECLRIWFKVKKIAINFSKLKHGTKMFKIKFR